MLLHFSHTVHSLRQEEPRFLQLQTTSFNVSLLQSPNLMAEIICDIQDDNLEWLAASSDGDSNSGLVDSE